jgi:hypothetical protein
MTAVVVDIVREVMGYGRWCEKEEKLPQRYLFKWPSRAFFFAFPTVAVGVAEWDLVG